MEHYVFVLVVSLVAITVPILLLIFAKLVRSGSPDPIQAEVRECGVEPASLALDTGFSARSSVIAVLFVVFDVEMILLFPWAVSFDRLALFGLIEVVIFLAILFVGFVYAWKRGALEWV